MRWEGADLGPEGDLAQARRECVRRLAPAATLLRKSALFPPNRTVVTPTTGDDEFQPHGETLELKDMPASYTLVLEGNTSISVRPKPAHLLSGLWSLRAPVVWYVTRPVLTVWQAVSRKPSPSIDIVLEATDARRLYWAFLEGMKAIVFLPGGRP
jgi:hypothetical protein